jgi:phage FluMu gp28-like protein
VKAALAMPVRAAFESRGIRILADDVLRHDLHKIVRSVTAAGNVRYDAERDESGHSDRFWALALAVHAAGRGNEAPCGIDPLPPPHERCMEERFFGL